jgi:preprotein translocase subunit YajC
MLLFIALEGAGGGLSTIVLVGGMLAIMYFFMIRPQSQREKKAKDYLNELVIGQQVVTAGGIHGKIVRIDADTFQVQIDKMTTVRVEKDAINADKTQKIAANVAKTDN